MQRVTGIGGVFFRAADPAHLSDWYSIHLGVDPAPDSYEHASWQQQSGSTVFAAMPADSPHFSRIEQTWAINFRVDDLNAIVDQLRTAGIDVEVDPETYPNGTFANLHDPEGNPVQLWQPAGADLRGSPS
ncbi:VOC family protein [Pseudonocardia sp. TRM90224]|uniref:VOC family protein n=1 Tax=Pseudonocardia sp. TRM90224 TaxID=2812678 RepID=UPI001E44DFC9|nr:VOC family protein [Pseudonocardia sp. TRM90224]